MSDQPQGQGSPQEPQGSDAPRGISAAEVNEIVNKAITARNKAFEKQFEAKLTEGFSGMSSKFEEMLSTLTAGKAADAATPTVAALKSPTDSPEFKGMLKKQAELEAKLAKAEQEKDAERAKVRDSQLRQRISDELTKHGVDAQRARLAVGHLIDADKRVRWGEDESAVFRDEDNSDLDLKTGIQSWLKSEDGKFYMPPRGVSGSGDRPGHGTPPKNAQEASMADIGTLIARQFGAVPIGQ